MRIAQVSPLFESVPPKLYGGTERVVHWLTEELVRQGHQVTLFASGDSITRARLISAAERSLRLDNNIRDEWAYIILQLEQVAQIAEEFDIIHWHTDYPHFPLSRHIPTAQVTTLHGRLDIPDLVPLYKEFRDMPVISISNAQRKPLPFANWQGTVYHGMPPNLFSLHPAPGQYLAFLGRISPEKGVDKAIEISKRSGIPLKIAAKVAKADEEYFREEIKPLMDHPLIEFVGEINEDQKDAFLGNAFAMLFPINWPEPFGIVLIEAMACGTPTIAFPCGSVPEIMQDGRTGFIVRTVDEAVAAIKHVPELSREDCRRVFETHFTDKQMTQNYLTLYEQLVKERSSSFPITYGTPAVSFKWAGDQDLFSGDETSEGDPGSTPSL